MDRQMDGHTDGWIARWMDRCSTVEWMDGWVGGWMNGWTDGQMSQREARLKPQVKELRRLLGLQIFQPSFILCSADVFLPFLRNQIHSSEALIWALIPIPSVHDPPAALSHPSARQNHRCDQPCDGPAAYRFPLACGLMHHVGRLPPRSPSAYCAGGLITPWLEANLLLPPSQPWFCGSTSQLSSPVLPAVFHGERELMRRRRIFISPGHRNVSVINFKTRCRPRPLLPVPLFFNSYPSSFHSSWRLPWWTAFSGVSFQN